MTFLKSLGMKILGVTICAYSAYYAWHNYGPASKMILATIMYGIGCVIYAFSSASTYNKICSSAKLVANPNRVSIEELYEVFKDMDSSMGKPWLGKIKTIPGKCLMFGSNIKGDILYMRKFFCWFFIHTGLLTYFVDTPENREQLEIKNREQLEIKNKERNKTKSREKHTLKNLDSKEGMICYSLLNQTFVENLADIFKVYLQKNEIIPFPSKKNIGRLYQFDEAFKLTGQKFFLLDMKRKPLYVIESSFPLINFSVQEYSTKKEVLSMQKKVFAFMSTYTFMLDGEEYGVFKQRFNLIRDTFEMDTKDGKLIMYNLSDKLGTNYIVKVDGVAIGSIADRFELTARNVVFDNFAIHVRDDRYTALLAGLAVMAVREKARDKSGSPL